MEEEIVEELSRRYCKSKRFIVLLIKMCRDNNIKDTIIYIKEYLIKCVKWVCQINKKQIKIQ